MIRPFTLVCFLLACGSGLYLYQAKHRVQVLDRAIEKTVHDTNERRERIRVLHAEWTLQNDPQRLQSLADQFLALKTVTPGQFTSLADLNNRLPAVPLPEDANPPPAPPLPPVADAPPPEEPKPVPVAANKPPPPPPPAPVAPKPAPVVAAAAPPPRPAEREHEREAEHRQPPSPPPRPVIAEVRAPVRATPVPTRPVLAAEPSRPPAVTPTGGGSALGMARSGSVSLPRPMPVTASQWVSTGNGGG
jgi:hypothetical protein